MIATARRELPASVALWLATLVYLSLPFLVGPLRTFFWRLIP